MCGKNLIRSVLHKTGLKYDANFLYKCHISSKIRHELAKTRLNLEQPLKELCYEIQPN